MEIVIDNESGFCFGVVKAISTAEVELEDGKGLFCLGDIVHNGQEVDRLRSKGLQTITHADMEALHGVTVLLRAHGEPPSTYALAKRNGLKVIDASCPVVLMLQKKIKAAYKRYPKAQIVIYGKQGHAEVNGLVGQTNGSAIVMESVDELCKLDLNGDIILFSQTTQSVSGFEQLVSVINERRKESALFLWYDTICRQVANRIPHIREFAAGFDLVLFVSGSKSSNGKVLFGECCAVNTNSYMVSSDADIDVSWLDGVESVGICGATSTPKWLMESVADKVRLLIR